MTVSTDQSNPVAVNVSTKLLGASALQSPTQVPSRKVLLTANEGGLTPVSKLSSSIPPVVVTSTA